MRRGGTTMAKIEVVREKIESKNKALVLEAFDTLFNRRDYAAAEKFWSPDYIQHSAHIPPGREGLFDLVKSLPAGSKYYGGIGYYHVSDTYIALFSHFIPCGVWEAVYILDGLLKNESDIQPDVLHADTQGQSEPVFALAHLLGIELMPRIRNWKSLDLCRPDPKARYEHIDSLFTENVDWNLIETHLPDMLRVVLSIKAGRISASTILRRLGTYSRKNRLYQAFCELGRVIRTGFLLRYISDAQLRSTIQGATNKSEALNRFLKWTFFGGEGVITENSRDEQRKTIKYNHLVANCLIFHNLCSLTRLVQHLEQRGETVSEDAIAAISPYLTEHINRFGDYTLNLGRKPPQPDYGYTLRRSASVAFDQMAH